MYKIQEFLLILIVGGFIYMIVNSANNNVPKIPLRDFFKNAEKSSFQNEKLGRYVFEVASAASKTQIKEAVETLFDVHVTQVNTLVMPAKRARKQRRIVTRTSQYKKAVVRLKEGETIELFEGVK